MTMERLQEKFSVLESKIAQVRARLEIADTLAERVRDLIVLDAQRIDTRRAKAELAEALAKWDCEDLLGVKQAMEEEARGSHA